MNSISTLTRAVASLSHLQQALFRRTFRVSASSNHERPHDRNKEGFDDPLNLLTAYAALPGSGGYGACPTMYDARKFSFFLPDSDPCRVSFEVPKILPSGVFRFTAGETLGPGSAKCACYKDPEYYSYHHMSFYDFHLHLSSQRNPVPDSKRKPS